MSILSVRLSEEEKAALQRRAKEEGCSAGALVRKWILEKPFLTSADLLKETESMMGDGRFAIKKRR
jgi:hypothetical protein